MTIDYDMPLYRPPSEGDNLIIQATLGCSFNHCTFCSMYKTKSYVERPLAQVFADIETAARAWPRAHRVFLADGDAMTLSMESLGAILDKLRQSFPSLARVSAYATPKNLLEKSAGDLAELRERGLRLIYFGIESGATAVLKRVRKGATQDTMARALERARNAGLKVSATVILGLAGGAGWEEHIAGTAELINRQPPTYLSTLQLSLDDRVADEFLAAQEPGFRFQDDAAVLAEQERLLSLLDPPRPVIFRSNHASNCLALAGTLPKDRDRLVARVAEARAGVTPLRPQSSRSF